MRNTLYCEKVKFYLLQFGQADNYTEIAKHYGQEKVGYRFNDAVRILMKNNEVIRNKEGKLIIATNKKTIEFMGTTKVGVPEQERTDLLNSDVLKNYYKNMDFETYHKINKDRNIGDMPMDVNIPQFFQENKRFGFGLWFALRFRDKKK